MKAGLHTYGVNMVAAAFSVAALIVMVVSCAKPETVDIGAARRAMAPGDTVEHSVGRVLASMNATPESRWLSNADRMPDDGCQKLKVYPPKGYFRQVFCDSNSLHYAAGQKIGITPIINSDDIWRIDGELVRVDPCADFYVDTLRYSYPYLIPQAAALLHDIGRTFNDTLKARGGGNYRLKVTSMLRTDNSVRRLRRVNRAAVDSSAHRFGTTFDISFSYFVCDRPGLNRTQEDLKNLLAEILYDFRAKGRCYTIFEHRQSCFHITVRS